MNTQAVATSNTRTRQEWAAIINADWRKSIESIIQTGRDLISAKEQLEDGTFHKMIEKDLPFSIRMSQRLMAIARHPKISNAAQSPRLPSSWYVLSELAKLSPEDFSDAERKGLITDKTSRSSAEAISHAYNGSDDVVGANRKVTGLPTPTEAKKIARATNKLVAANDGHMYSGASDEERQTYIEERTRTFRTIEAIEFLSGMDVSPDQWRRATEVEPHWLVDFNKDNIGPAILWLEGLRLIMDTPNEKQEAQAGD